MRTAASALKILREKEGPVSGARMASRLGLTRAAVWKAVHMLREEGYEIEGVSNRGYTLTGETDRLSASGIESSLSSMWSGMTVRICEKLTSTSTLARQRADTEKQLLIAANAQTAGRGRRGRDFYSPPGAGLYFSLAMEWGREEAPVLVTTMAAVATALVLEREFGVAVGIKWVNDLYLHDRKICGILTEAVTGLESGVTASLVIGIGINLMEPAGGYPAPIRRIAGALVRQGTRIDRNRLISLIVNDLGSLIGRLPDRGYLDRYRERCFILGRKVRLDTGQTIVPHAISDEGALLYRDGNAIRSLQTGEVSILL
ncbi:MAG: biotin--[acetyl-CoA-carboxylase] ligase [Clostridiaceae bacterium]|nr:biotin--[acetyl-CoA-carboxylase] ligase [Clostridiaceae bacterium]